METAARRNPEPRPAARPSSVLSRLSRRTWQTLILVFFVLAAIRAFLPYLVKDYVNRTLSRIPGYRARVADIDIHLWRGAYSIQGLDVEKREGKVPVPFFSAPTIDLSVQWRELFHGALVGEIDLRRPKLNFVTGPTTETSQTSVDRSWQERVKELFPLRINRFEAKDGEIHYRDFHSHPQVDLRIDRLHMIARNLTNSRQISKTLAATIDVEGRPLETASLKAHTDLDPYREKPTYQLRGELLNADLRKFNDFLKAYGNFDVEKGTLSVYTEVAAADGRFRGYVKPLVEDLDVFDWKEKADSPLQKVWEGVVAAAAWAFRNHPRDRFATRVHFTGSFDDPQYSTWSVVAQILKNTFIKAIPKGLERSVGVEQEKGSGAGPGKGAVTIVEDGEEKESTDTKTEQDEKDDDDHKPDSDGERQLKPGMLGPR
jgi:uncharacterized protein DUF748